MVKLLLFSVCVLQYAFIYFTSTPIYFTSHPIYFTSHSIYFTSLDTVFSSSSWSDSEKLGMVLLDRGKGKRPIKVREIFSGQELVQPRHQSFNVVKQPTVTHGEITKKRDVVGRHSLFMYP